MATFSIVFQPTFQHEPWVDNVDRVQAGGDNGFNVRFGAIQADLRAVATAFAAVNDAVNRLGAGATGELRATVAPVMTDTAAVGWGHRNGLAEKKPQQTSASGMTSIQLPPGARIRSLRATGRNSGTGDLRISLFRQSITTIDAPAELIARVPGAGDPFNELDAAEPAMEFVDTERFKYYITAQLNNAQAADAVVLTGFQVVYTTA